MTSITIPSLPKIEDVSTVVANSDVPALVHWRRCEPVGFWFENRFDPETNGAASPVKAVVTKFPTGVEVVEQKARKNFDSKKVVKLSEEDLETDWYEVLELEQDDAATDDEIRVAHRKRCLATHPDKMPDQDDKMFKKVARAFDILGNEESRRAFDSSRPFDNAIPGDNVTAENFYKTFTPVFDRNKKWSQDGEHTPSLGEADTPIEKVNKFYTAWMGFKSWRDFSHEVDLEGTSENMSREERRYYQRENQRKVEKARKAEAKRVRTLVERAMAADPRLKAHAEAEESKRVAEIEARNASRNKRAEEERKRKQDEADAKRKAADTKVQVATDNKAVIKASLMTVRAFFNDAGILENIKTNKFFPDVVRVPNIMWLFNKGDPEKLESYVEMITAESTEDMIPVAEGNAYIEGGAAGEGIAAVIVFNTLVENREREIGVNRFGEAIKKSDPVEVPVSKKA